MGFADIRKRIIETGMRPNRGASRIALDWFEKDYRVHLPEQVKENYLIMDGMDPLAEGPQPLSCMRFWPIEEWRPIRALFPECEELVSFPDDVFICADYAVESFWFGIDLTNHSMKYGSVQGVFGLRDGIVAINFAEFISEIEAGPHFVFSYLSA